MFGSEPPAHVPKLPRWTLIIHAAQLLLAVVILGLDAYGIRWIAYNALIYSLVVCLCTMAVCLYLLASRLFLHKLFNVYIALGLHLWMILFWIIDLGLVANLARKWASPSCGYSYYYSGYYCSYYIKRDLLVKRDDTTVGAYYGALAAGAVFAAIQFASWILATIILFLAFNKHRSSPAAHVQPTTGPQYAPTNPQSAVPLPMEKYNQPPAPTAPYQTPQQQYAQPILQPQQQQQHYPQQPYPNPQYAQGPYAQDPIPRQDTVSPVSAAAYGAPSVVSDMTAHHTGANPPSEIAAPVPTHAPYPTGANELGAPVNQSEQVKYPTDAAEMGAGQPVQQQHYGRPEHDMPELASHK